MATTGRIAQRKTQVSASTLPEVGKIKIGEKRQSSKGVEYPVSLDYFRPTGNYAGEFYKIYGDKPSKITVAFISDDISEVCNERYECWDKGKRYGWGDGVTFTIWDGQQYIENVPANDPRVVGFRWDMTLTLRFVLLEMKGVMGVWTFQTKAKQTTIPSIVKAFDFVRERANTIIGFPFNLMVEKHKSYNPGEQRNYPVVSLVPNFSEESIEMVKNFLQQGGAVTEITTKMITQQNVRLLNEGGETK